LPKNLVVVRAGDQSLHPEWLGDPATRQWDIIVNYYGDDPNCFRDQGQQRIDSKGPKWPALHALVHDHAAQIDAYDYLWFPDDDLASDQASINRLFEICHQHDLELAQPSLTFDSIIGHPITATNKAFLLRYTSFVEIMAPCFSRSFFQRCRASFNTNLSGYGLDFLWPTWASAKTKVAIIDAIAVKHTRARGSQYHALNEKGITPEQELTELVLRERVRPVEWILGGIMADGAAHTIWNTGHEQLIRHILKGYLPEFATHADLLYHMIEPALLSLGQAK